MLYPQDEAKDYGQILKLPILQSIGDFSCLAMTYLWCIGIEPEKNSEMIKNIISSINNGFLDFECTVLDANALLKHFSGKNYKVDKFDNENINIKTIRSRTPVRFKAPGTIGHWVGVENGQIAFNSIKDSKSVQNGKPVAARFITLRK